MLYLLERRGDTDTEKVKQENQKKVHIVSLLSPPYTISFIRFVLSFFGNFVFFLIIFVSFATNA